MGVKPELAFDVCSEVYRSTRELHSCGGPTFARG
jgi:hypothetical protein